MMRKTISMPDRMSVWIAHRIERGEKQIKKGQYTTLESDQDITKLFRAIEAEVVK